MRATLHAAISREAYDEAFELSGRLLGLAAAFGDRSLEAEAHQYRAVSAARLTRLAEAKAHYRLAERLYGELERPQGLAAVSLNRGILDLRLGDHASATERLQRAERLFGQLGDRRGERSCTEAATRRHGARPSAVSRWRATRTTSCWRRRRSATWATPSGTWVRGRTPSTT
ncbi:MAG: hypothetical protein P8Y05_12030 [Deinococcales bacterium]